MTNKRSEDDDKSVLEWSITVPILSDPYVTGILIKVFGVSIGLVLVLIYAIAYPHMSPVELLMIGAGLVVLMTVLILFSVGVVMRNRVHYKFKLMDKGISQFMGKPERKSSCYGFCPAINFQ
jgi:hypothetical protein